MSLIVAGRFDTFAEAQKAAKYLFAEGFAQEDVTLFFVNPPGQHHLRAGGGDRSVDPDSKKVYKGARMGLLLGATVGASMGAMLCTVFKLPLLITVIAASVGAYLGSLIGAMIRTHDSEHGPISSSMHQSGVLIAIHVTPDNQAEALAVLRKTKAKDIERANGRWQHGQWSNFDPLKKPSLPKKFAL